MLNSVQNRSSLPWPKLKQDANPQFGARRKDNPSIHDTDMVIVGSGAAGTAVLAQLAKAENLPPKLDITILERSPKPGPGFVYNDQVVLPEHLTNIAAGKVDITQTDIPDPQNSDFMKWLRQEAKGKQPVLSSEERARLSLPPRKKSIMSRLLPAATNSRWFASSSNDKSNWDISKQPSRQLLGHYLANRFERSVQDCRNRGMAVTVLPNMEARELKNQEGIAELALSGPQGARETVLAPTVVMTTGHWAPKNPEKPFPGVYEQPWPASKLIAEIPDGEHVGILGSSLSAIDTALTLAHRAGRFERDRKGDLQFIPHSKSQKSIATPWRACISGGANQTDEPENGNGFKLTMYSRGGKLPAVMGHVVNDPPFEFQHLTRENIDRAIARNNGFLPIDEVFGLLKRDVAHYVPKIKNAYPDWDALSLEEALEKGDASFDAQDKQEKLQTDLDKAKRSLRTKKLLPLQNVFYQTYQIFDYAYQYLSAKDRLRYDRAKSMIMNLTGPFPVDNAEKILALMKSGRLEIRKLGQNYQMSNNQEAGQGVQMAFDDPTAGRVQREHRYFIKALGQSGDVTKDPSPLTRSLLREGLMTPVLVPFRENEETPPESSHITYKDGKPYYQSEGVLLDTRTYEAVPCQTPKKTPLIFAMSTPFSLGQIAMPEDLSAVTIAAERISARLKQFFNIVQSGKRQAEPTHTGLSPEMGAARALLRDQEPEVYEPPSRLEQDVRYAQVG